MPETFPGSYLISKLARLRYSNSNVLVLNSLKQKLGDIFWFHSSSLPSSRVLVIFDSTVISGILQEESWLFSKPIEPWHNHHRSNYLYDRLLGDSAYLADGMHHRKRSLQFLQLVSSPLKWQLLDSEILSTFESIRISDINTYHKDLADQLLQKLLHVYFGLSIQSSTLYSIHQALNLAWTSLNKNTYCPFRFTQKNSSLKQRATIDSARRALYQLLIDEDISVDDNDNSQPVELTKLALLDDLFAFMLSVVHKLPSILSLISNELSSLGETQLSIFAKELKTPLYSYGNDVERCNSLAFHCVTQSLSKIDPPIPIIKRITVCDVLINKTNVPEMTETWIPVWHLKNNIFGSGCYECPGKELSLSIATRFLQWSSYKMLRGTHSFVD